MCADVFHALREFASAGVATRRYYAALLENRADDVLAVAAACALLQSNVVAEDQNGAILRLCRFPAVRALAERHFGNAGFAKRMRGLEAPGAAQPQRAVAASDAPGSDYGAQVLGEIDRFLATGTTDFLLAAATLAESERGWRHALPLAVRNFAVAPLDLRTIAALAALLDGGNDASLMAELAGLLSASNIYPAIALALSARAALRRGEPAECLARLDQMNTGPAGSDPSAVRILALTMRTRAEALEKLGAYQKAFAAYNELNRADRDPKVDPTEFYKGMVAKRRLPIPLLPDDSRTDCVMMLGFPRSGTTLLENALAAHPDIETFEEITALKTAIDAIEQAVEAGGVPVLKQSGPYLAARRTYYAEIDAARRKSNAAVLVDKMPIRSGEAVFLSRLFPEQRFIFSIRHPFDVVLSCFKQRFGANPAMANFHTVGDAARLYDFVMQQWFSVHTMDDPKVCYVRYEDLMLDFESTMARALGFLGLGWSDEVRDFARKAEQRSAKTPSYQKVRQGLSIGVQSTWRNYAFLFNTPQADALKGWAKFFGYETE